MLLFAIAPLPFRHAVLERLRRENPAAYTNAFGCNFYLIEERSH
jgi:hypothetical protein